MFGGGAVSSTGWLGRDPLFLVPSPFPLQWAGRRLRPVVELLAACTIREQGEDISFAEVPGFQRLLDVQQQVLG